MKITDEQIELVTHFAWQLVGTPYKLGSNVPQGGGMDCSAFCLELLRALKLWGLDDATAQQIQNRFRMEKGMFIKGINVDFDKLDLCKGDFLFFGKSASEITHIAFAITPSYMLEAGGDDKTGMIRLRSISWRRDLVAVARFT